MNKDVTRNCSLIASAILLDIHTKCKHSTLSLKKIFILTVNRGGLQFG